VLPSSTGTTEAMPSLAFSQKTVLMICPFCTPPSKGFHSFEKKLNIVFSMIGIKGHHLSTFLIFKI